LLFDLYELRELRRIARIMLGFYLASPLFSFAVINCYLVVIWLLFGCYLVVI